MALALTALAPETADVDFTWDDFRERVNSELVANWGIWLIACWVLPAYKRFDGAVPTPEAFDETDEMLLNDIRAGFESVAALYEAVKLKPHSPKCDDSVSG